MFLKYLTWIFAGLFVLFGVSGLVSESPAWRQIWAGLSTLSLGGFAGSMVKDALATGRIRIQHSVIRRANRPRLFWASIALVAATGAVVSVWGLKLLFFGS